jgi:hypothetical protein
LQREKKMTTRLVVAVSAAILSTQVVSARSAPHHGPIASSAYRIGTVLNVKRQEFQSNAVGYTTPTDAPLQSDVYAYDVSVRVDCGTYVGRYESPFDSLVAVFRPNRLVRVRVQKHIMYIDIPGEYPEYRMAITKHARASTAPCDKQQAVASKTIH